MAMVMWIILKNVTTVNCDFLFRFLQIEQGVYVKFSQCPVQSNINLGFRLPRTYCTRKSVDLLRFYQPTNLIYRLPVAVSMMGSRQAHGIQDRGRVEIWKWGLVGCQWDEIIVPILRPSPHHLSCMMPFVPALRWWRHGRCSRLFFYTATSPWLFRFGSLLEQLAQAYHYLTNSTVTWSDIAKPWWGLWPHLELSSGDALKCAVSE